MANCSECIITSQLSPACRPVTIIRCKKNCCFITSDIPAITYQSLVFLALNHIIIIWCTTFKMIFSSLNTTLYQYSWLNYVHYILRLLAPHYHIMLTLVPLPRSINYIIIVYFFYYYNKQQLLLYMYTGIYIN